MQPVKIEDLMHLLSEDIGTGTKDEFDEVFEFRTSGFCEVITFDDMVLFCSESSEMYPGDWDGWDESKEFTFREVVVSTLREKIDKLQRVLKLIDHPDAEATPE